jgi:hypothetical protein
MFTTPDHSDAATSPAPFTAVGPKPKGFYLDCDPATGQEGTAFRAEDFNELIVNLRRLLDEAAVTGVKGDPLMLVDGIVGLINKRFWIGANLTLNVTPTGAVTPADPWAGDPFNSVASALAWLNKFFIGSGVTVSINVAAGTYSHTAPIVVAHRDGPAIQIVGASRVSTILSFPNNTEGVRIRAPGLGLLKTLTIQGTGAADAGLSGCAVEAGAATTLDGVWVINMAGTGLYVGGAVRGLGDIQANDNKSFGTLIEVGASMITDSLMIARSGAIANVWVAGRLVVQNALHTTAGARGVYVNGGNLGVKTFNVFTVTVPAEAVTVTNRGTAQAQSPVVADSWYASDSVGGWATFRAELGGFINPVNALNALQGCSPARGTVGNQQGYIATAT